ncbi:hypothetical protein, conserved in T. vivax [Trypanosoma vivax Y486]|nr:hypothetical protein, conserved in T. vivax [Trypanosoma vivax Y486]|eukprot:CCD20983.1 hypothetical protein, conserved in T. vivax [Trypanosoma vivax Y486]
MMVIQLLAPATPR